MIEDDDYRPEAVIVYLAGALLIGAGIVVVFFDDALKWFVRLWM